MSIAAEKVGIVADNESVISNYLLLYDQVKPTVATRHFILKSLTDLQNRFQVLLNQFAKKSRIDAEKLKTLFRDAEQFLKEAFPGGIAKHFLASTLNGNLTFSDLALRFIQDLSSASIYNVTQTDIDRATHQCQWLQKIKSCIVEHGLHRYIWERNPKLFKRYNIIIEYTVNRKPYTECRCLMPWITLESGYLNRFQQQKPLLMNGSLIATKNIRKMKVTTTLLMDNEIPYFKDRYHLRTDFAFANKCNDESGDIVDTLLNSPVSIPTPKERQPFIQSFIAGIEQLQKGGDRFLLPKKTKEPREYTEDLFRNFFEAFLRGAGYEVGAEMLQRNGRSDLCAECPDSGAHIVEFKIWRGNNVAGITKQINSYLTDFESMGYIFVVNPNKNSILTAYKTMVTGPEACYIAESWKEHKLPGKGFCYYESKHQFGNTEKTIFHFIYKLHP